MSEVTLQRIAQSHDELMEYLRPYLDNSGFVPSLALLLLFYALLRGVRNMADLEFERCGRRWALHDTAHNTCAA